MHSKYSRSLLSEQIHRYFIQEVKYQKQPYHLFSFILTNGDRVLINIWTQDCYAQAFYKNNTNLQDDICIKEGHIRYVNQIHSFINAVDTFIMQKGQHNKNKTKSNVSFINLDSHAFSDSYDDWDER